MANKPEKKPNRSFKKTMNNLSSMINDLSSSIYGTTNDELIDNIDKNFHDILNNEMKELKGSSERSGEDTTSFIAKLYTSDKKTSRMADIFNNQISNMSFGSDDTTIGTFLSEVYKNKLIRQCDIFDVANQLIELREAVNTMRDAITTADIVDGRINREIKINGVSDNDKKTITSVIEKIEKKFELQKKIKDYIVKKSLIYGEYYVYVIPYSVIFSEFMKNKNKYNVSHMYSYESAGDYKKLEEAAKKGYTDYINLGHDKDVDTFIESCYNDYRPDIPDLVVTDETLSKLNKQKNEQNMKEEFKKDMKNILSRITVVNSDVPLPILEEGLESIEHFRESFVNESGDTFVEKKEDIEKPDNTFLQFMKKKNFKSSTPNATSQASEGITIENDDKESKLFEDVTDCYVKMIDPTRVIEIKIMGEVIGYFYIKTDNMTPISGILSSTLYQQKFNQKRSEQDIVGDIAARIIEKFDHKFLKDNPKFKSIIVEALNYYDLNEQAVKFQFIPKEYMVPFKIDVDEDGDGTSMLDGSLFYAKLYLMILLFKIMSIILNSNDTKVNYIKQSGLDKNLINKVQEICIQKQARTINIYDLFNYTSLINKIGNGSEQFIPVGKSGDRPVETEILSGQDVQINNELMELLRNSYILGTGVPAAIMNYLNEADFAKSIEVANTKMNGRTVNYQIDLNPSITKLYQLLLKYSTNLEDNVIEKITVGLVPPKGSQNIIKAESIDNFTRTADFLVNLYYGETSDDPLDEIKIRKFKQKLAKDMIPLLDFEAIEKIYQEASIDATGESIKPKDEPTEDDILNAEI